MTQDMEPHLFAMLVEEIDEIRTKLKRMEWVLQSKSLASDLGVIQRRVEELERLTAELSQQRELIQD